MIETIDISLFNIPKYTSSMIYVRSELEKSTKTPYLSNDYILPSGIGGSSLFYKETWSWVWYVSFKIHTMVGVVEPLPLSGLGTKVGGGL